jgi:hypothetical protein
MKTGIWGGIGLLVLLICMAGCSMDGSPAGDRAEADESDEQSQPYLYGIVEDPANKVRMHMLRVDPELVDLVAIRSNVTHSGLTGINGGFFYDNQLLSIAVEDDMPAAGERGGYGSGWFNIKYARGTLVYDKTNGELSVQVAASAEELKVADRSRYWAQGGISMELERGEGPEWRLQADAEAAPYPDDERLRSAMVYDEAGNVHLIVTSTMCTLEQLRDAIIRERDAYGFIEGIFLDGDGSSQLMASEELLAGDGRPVVQMIAIGNP